MAMATKSKQSQEEEQESHGLDRPLKEGERLVASSRRPDGTMRKPVRIRAGYTPQDEVAIYQSKGAAFRRGVPQVPPGYDPLDDVSQRPKTKSAKKNQKRKEKKLQTDSASSVANRDAAESVSSDLIKEVSVREDVDAVTHQIDALSVSNISSNKIEEKESTPEKVNMEKRIRALRKKIRAIESLQVSLSTSEGALNSEQAEKLSRLEIWQKELNDLEAQKG